MASYQDCIKAIVDSQKDGGITAEQAEEILSAIDTIAADKKLNKFDEIDVAVKDKVNAIAAKIREAALIEKRNALLNLKVRKIAMNQIRQFGNSAEGFSAYLTGSVKSKPGSKLSVDARIKALTAEYLGRLIHDLEKEDLMEVFSSGKLDDEIVRELWAMPGSGKPITNSIEAHKVAKIINRYQTELVGRQNRAGAWINLAPGYVVRQTHDMAKIRAMPKEEWVQFVLERVDPDKTFGDLDPDKYVDFLNGAYDGLATGIHYRAKGAGEQDSSYTLLGFKGPKNLAKKVSAERILHFKDADAWLEYNGQFGHGNLRESVIFGFEHNARNLGLLQTLGTNPKAMVERLLSDIRKANKGNVSALDSISDIKIMNEFKELDGTTRIPDSITMSKIGRGLRVIQNVSKLGGALISSITDLPTQVAELRYQGVPLVSAWFNAFWNPIRGRSSGEQREIAQLLGVGFDGLLGDAISRFDSNDTMPGVLAKLQQRFFKLNGMNYWNDAHMTGVTLMSSAYLAQQVDAGQLSPDALSLLSQYGVTEKDMPLLKAAIKEAGGSRYLMPDELDNLSDEELGQIFGFIGEFTSKDLLSGTQIFDKNPQVGKKLNGVKLEAASEPDWQKYKWKKFDDEGAWQKLAKEAEAKGKKVSAGAVVVEPDGRVWIYEPANHFGGYEHTFPKGNTVITQNIHANAAREVFEETGLIVELVDFVGDFEGDTTVTRYYMAKRKGGAPWSAHWEADNVKLSSWEDALNMLNKDRDKNILNKAKGVWDAGKEGYNYPIDKISPAISRKIKDARDEFKLRLRTLFSDRSRTAIPHPGAAENAIMNSGTQPGTALGEAVRLFMQFKSFPISVVRKGIGREIYGHGADSLKDAFMKGQGDILGLVHLMVATTLFGYAAMALKDLAKGREPRDPSDPKTIAAAMAQGGGLGIYGDFLFGEFSRYGRSAVATLAGPTFGQIDDVAEMYTRMRTGEDAAAQGLRFVMNNTPFINLFYTRAALDYLFIYQLQEMVSPGYLHRLEARIQRENDQRFFLPPSQEIPYGGGDQILEGVR